MDESWNTGFRNYALCTTSYITYTSHSRMCMSCVHPPPHMSYVMWAYVIRDVCIMTKGLRDYDISPL